MLLAFGFSNWWMLGWLAAAAIPLVIHLWNRRRHREVRWAAMEYLLAALEKSARRMQVENWLLLALRTLIVVCVVMAVAGPTLALRGAARAADHRVHRVFVLDGSYSMAFQPDDATRFEKAKRLVQQVVESSAQGDSFSLVLMSAPPRVIVGTPTFDAQAFLDEVSGLRIVEAGADLNRTLEEVERLLNERAAEADVLGRTEVVFLTDLGRNTWSPAPEASGQQQWTQLTERLGEQAALVVIDVGQREAENLAVTRLEVEEPYVTLAGRATLRAEVRNFGSQSHDVRLRFLVDGQPIRETPMSLAAGRSESVAFSHRFTSAGDRMVEAVLVDDALEADNHRWLSVPVRSQLRVLCVNGNAVTGDFRGETDYLTVALQPLTSASAVSPVATEVINDSRLSEVELDAYDCVMLANVEQFTASEAAMLRQYVAAGGGLVFFLGDRVLADRYNRELFENAARRVLPARVEDAAASSVYRFDPLEYRHEIVRPFQGNDRAGLLFPQVYRYWQLDLTTESSARVALAFSETNDPAIVEESIGQGRSIVVAFPASLASRDASGEPWTIMPQLPAFLPLVQEVLASAVRSRIDFQNGLVGDPILSADRPTTTGRATLRTPGGEQVTLEQSTLDAASRWIYPDTTRSGAYQLAFSASAPPRQFAVNVDPSESDLAKLDVAELPDAFAAFTESSGVVDTGAVDLQSSSGIHHWFLYTALALLLTEGFAAWYLGHRQR